MARKINKRGPTAPEMNITPLIDVVFLLIIFFMLVNNINADQRPEMIVPELDEPQARKLDPDIDRVVVNVKPVEFDRESRQGNHLAISGQARSVKVGLREYQIGNLSAVRDDLEQAKQRNPEVEVLLRADSALYYDEVQPVLQAITGAGIKKVNLVTYTEEQ